MPKLAQARMEQNRRRIETAALRLFTRQGFHGTNIREIAKKAGVSTGAIYTYYKTKQALFESIVRNYEERMEVLRAQMFRNIADPLSPGDLKALTEEIRSIVYDNAEYWFLMYIDVIEFKNRHFAHTFHDLAGQFRSRMGSALDKAKERDGWCGLDPAITFATIYLHFFTYFLVEKLFAGNRHLGVADEAAIDHLIALFVGGLWRRANVAEPVGQKRSARSQEVRAQAGGAS